MVMVIITIRFKVKGGIRFMVVVSVTFSVRVSEIGLRPVS